MAYPWSGERLSINFEEILSFDHGKFEEQNKGLESSIIIAESLLM